MDAKKCAKLRNYSACVVCIFLLLGEFLQFLYFSRNPISAKKNFGKFCKALNRFGQIGCQGLSLSHNIRFGVRMIYAKAQVGVCVRGAQCVFRTQGARVDVCA